MEELQKAVEDLTKTVADKDEHIKKQTDDLVNLRKKAEGSGKSNEDLAKEIEALKEKDRINAKNIALERLSKGDPEKRAKIEKELDSVSGNPEDVNGWLEKGQKAATLAGVTTPDVSAGGSGGGAAPSGGGDKDFSQTEQGKELAAKMGLKLEVPKKEENK